MPEVDAEDLALEKRKYIYKHGLYVKHVASNRYTRVSELSAFRKHHLLILFHLLLLAIR